MNHAKLVRTASGLAYATGHHWDHLLGVHLLRDHPLVVLLLLGAPEMQTKPEIANADRASKIILPFICLRFNTTFVLSNLYFKYR